MTPSSRSLLYFIRVRGQFDERWLRWFDGLTLTRQPDDETTVIQAVLDQSGLHGILNRIFELGIELLAVQAAPISPDPNPERKK
ncbi:MAG: hypothetical protein AB1457_13280 [Chloroflexota bacterium]|nr:MAG: hypothetical protein KatS3mg045_0777 [Bellilinea sp.]